MRCRQLRWRMVYDEALRCGAKPDKRRSHRCRSHHIPLIGGASCRRCTAGSRAEIEKLNQRVEEQAGERPGARLLMTHPGVGPITALATDVFLGDPKRFADGKALASYVGIIPSEYSSGGRQRFGGLSKQGNPLLRFLWCEAAAHAVRRDPELQRFYRRKLVQKGLGKARVAAARKLGIRLWIMLRDQIDYQEFCRRGQMQQKSGDACAGMPGTRYGANSHRPID